MAYYSSTLPKTIFRRRLPCNIFSAGRVTNVFQWIAVLRRKTEHKTLEKHMSPKFQKLEK